MSMDSSQTKEETFQQKIANSEVFKNNNMTIAEIFRFIVFVCLFVVIILNQVKTQSGYLISAGVKDFFYSEDFEKIYRKDDVIIWVVNDFLPLMDQENYYLDYSKNNDAYQRVA